MKAKARNITVYMSGLLQIQSFIMLSSHRTDLAGRFQLPGMQACPTQ